MTDLSPFDDVGDAPRLSDDRRFGSLVDFLFPTPAKRSVGSILGWWEKRRLPYNLIVGTAGAFATATFIFLAWLPPFSFGGQLSPEILIPITIFGVMANVCYTFGSVLEILAHKIWGRDVLPIGPALFRMGLTFSVGLALLPALLSVIIWVARVLDYLVF
ncbi:MAG: hypothetical protein R3253_12370 [Longimicrobiales bacterium]|nr:hypothetical protein [Longimicrobiales bacterium]